MSEKERLAGMAAREYATTRRLLEAYPPERANFRPHERSSTARDLAWTFAAAFDAQTSLILSPVTEFTPKPPPAPETWAEMIVDTHRKHDAFIRKLEGTTDRHLATTMRAPVSPGQMVDVPRSALMWMLLCDQIHHRGQLSVYLRMAGGKVPSIYGPSADEPWA